MRDPTWAQVGAGIYGRQNPPPGVKESSEGDQKAAAKKRRSEIIKILIDPQIWGRDFGTALMTLPSWLRSKEITVVFYPHTITSSTSYNTSELRKASALAGALHNELVSGPHPKFKVPELAAMLNKPSVKLSELMPSGQPLLEKGKLGVLLRTADVEKLQVLAEDLTVDSLIKRFDFQPEIKIHVNKHPGGARPEVLTYYKYADGAITFVESEIDSPGYITKAFVNAPEVLNILLLSK